MKKSIEWRERAMAAALMGCFAFAAQADGTVEVVEVQVAPMLNAVASVYNADWSPAQQTGENVWEVNSNELVKVIYQADDDHFFEDGSSLVTNEVAAVANPTVTTLAALPAAPAEPSARIGKVVQRYPWNGIMDVEYRCKNWGGRYRLILKVKVGENEQLVKVDTSSRRGRFYGNEAIDLRELFGDTRGEVKVTAKVRSAD